MRSIQTPVHASDWKFIMKRIFSTTLAAAAMICIGGQISVAQTSQLKKAHSREIHNNQIAPGLGVTSQPNEVSQTGSTRMTPTKGLVGRDAATAAHQQIIDQHGIVPGSVY